MLIDTKCKKIVTKTPQKMKKWGYKLVDLLYPIKTTLIYEIQCNKVKMLTTKKKKYRKRRR